MRKPMVAGNWKMHSTLAEARSLVAGIGSGLTSGDKVEVVVCPPFTLLADVGADASRIGVKLGGQNVYCETHGAFTGEIAPAMLKDIGCDYVIIGHSERRHVFGETGDLLHRKVQAALAAGLGVIFCLGETLEQRDGNQTEAVVESQLGELGGSKVDLSRIVLAYEPVWAIGTGRTATPEQAQAVHAFLRAKVSGIWGG
ncbi:MAG: triose-phosphate isomerase, partial [bacterium]|nr:triose-phosphate isomerase [bacterium]